MPVSVPARRAERRACRRRLTAYAALRLPAAPDARRSAYRRNAMPLLEELKQRARRLKAETFALYLAARHPETPWYAKLVVAGIVAYTFSPIDVIPDFVPILGYLDDLILLPMGIALAIKMIPTTVWLECRARAQEVMLHGKPTSYVAGAMIIVL